MKRVLIGIVLTSLFLLTVLQAQKAASSPRSVSDVLREYAPKAEGILKPQFKRAGLSYPQKKLALLAFKQERRLELWAKDKLQWKYVTEYPITAASGSAGPKLKEGDRQVPEGIYRLVGLNPNSRFHLSMKVNYPNAFDLNKARKDRRTKLGYDIFIHGKAVSIGCIAIGDAAIEQLFVLVARTGMKNVEVIIAPSDFRRTPIPTQTNPTPAWLPQLYANISRSLKRFPLQP